MMVFAEGTTSTEDAIIAQAVALDENFNLEEYEFTVVTLDGTNSNARGVEESEKAIRTSETVDGVITITTILPYRISEDGELISSFEDIPNQAARSSHPVTYVDTIVTVTAMYERYPVVQPYYRPLGVSASWNSSVSGVYVYDMMNSPKEFKIYDEEGMIE